MKYYVIEITIDAITQAIVNIKLIITIAKKPLEEIILLVI